MSNQILDKITDIAKNQAKTSFSPDFYQKLKSSGLLHLVAASGYNISIVTCSLGGLASLVIKNRCLKIATIVTLVALYIIVTGAEASVIRAGIVGTVGFIANSLASLKASKRIFILTIMIMLLMKPSWLWDLGFELSVAATFGLLWLKPNLMRASSERASELMGSLSASAATIPILVIRLGWQQVSWVGVLLNLPASLLVTPIMIAGTTVGLVGMVYPALGHLLAIVSRPALQAMIVLIDRGAWLNNLLINQTFEH